MRFEDLQFNPHPYEGVMAKQWFGDYEISVVSLKDNGIYEVGIFNKDGNFVQLPGIHPEPTDEDDFVDDVIHYNTPDDVSGIMLKLQLIAGVPA